MKTRRDGYRRWRGFVCLRPTRFRNVLIEKQMASAGWHYAPTKESNDFAKCAYCELSLDGWEDTDNPLDEHQRRSPSCTFFNWRPAKRPTKKARASLQSVANSATSLYGDDSESNAPAKKARAKKTKNPEPTFGELANAPRGRKRPSTAAQGSIIIYDGSKDTDSEVELHPPPTKKRATRASLAADQARDHNADHKMTGDSDVESITSTMSKTTKQPAKKKPGRRTSKARAPSKSRAAGTRKPKVVLSDDELDRVLAADLDRPLTDEEEGFKNFKTPFIRPPARRLTRSRTSIAVEESARDAPEGVLLHTSALAKRGRSRTPAVRETPLKNFNFRESGQDFSMPVRVPKHLFLGDKIKEDGKSLERRRQEGVAEGIARGFSTELTDVEANEPEVKKAPAKKVAKGRKKGSVAMVVAEDEPEAPKPKRGKLVKKTSGIRSRSNTVENRIQLPAVEIIIPSPEITAQYEQSSGAVPDEPKRGRKGELMKGTSRDSAISIASTAVPVPDTPQELTGPEPAEPILEPAEPTPEPHQSFMDVDPAPTDLSDASSVIRYDVAVARPVLAPFSDAEPEEPKEPTPQPEKPKRGKKTSRVSKAKKPTRSSVLSQATTLSMGTDGTASVINSGEESDMSHASHTGPAGRTRKVVKNSKKTLVAQKSREDMLKKGSESFFGSSQNEEMSSETKRGRGQKLIGTADMNAKGSFIEKMSIDGGSAVSDAGDAPMDVREELPAASGGVVSWADADYPRLSAAEELSATDVETEGSEQVESPVDIPPSPARRPLSPVRTAINIPLATTPRSHRKVSGRPVSSRSWTAVELESVLANLNTSDEEEDNGGQALGAREIDMTVEEWIRFSAAEAEFRMTREAERVIGVFEREGRRAMECVEGLVTVD